MLLTDLDSATDRKANISDIGMLPHGRAAILMPELARLTSMGAAEPFV